MHESPSQSRLHSLFGVAGSFSPPIFIRAYASFVSSGAYHVTGNSKYAEGARFPRGLSRNGRSAGRGRAHRIRVGLPSGGPGERSWEGGLFGPAILWPEWLGGETWQRGLGMLSGVRDAVMYHLMQMGSNLMACKDNVSHILLGCRRVGCWPSAHELGGGRLKGPRARPQRQLFKLQTLIEGSLIYALYFRM